MVALAIAMMVAITHAVKFIQQTNPIIGADEFYKQTMLVQWFIIVFDVATTDWADGQSTKISAT